MRFFPCQSCSLTVLLAAWKGWWCPWEAAEFISGSATLPHSHAVSSLHVQEVDFCTARPQVKEGHQSTSSWNLFSNASLALGSWASNPCLRHFCLRLPLILCNSSVTNLHIIPLWISTTFFFQDEQFWEETFQIIFFRKKILKACEYKQGKFVYCLESTS